MYQQVEESGLSLQFSDWRDQLDYTLVVGPFPGRLRGRFVHLAALFF